MVEEGAQILHPELARGDPATTGEGERMLDRTLVARPQPGFSHHADGDELRRLTSHGRQGHLETRRRQGKHTPLRGFRVLALG